MKQCPNCGTQLNDDVLFCTECGNQIPQGNVCPHCGAPVNIGDTFCQNCGEKVDEVHSSTPADSTQKKCPHCGAYANEGNAFCENCGKNLADESINFASNDIKQEAYTIEKSPNKMKMIIPIVIGIIAVAIIGGGWWYWKSSQSSKEITSVTKKDSADVATVENEEIPAMDSADIAAVEIEEIPAMDSADIIMSASIDTTIAP